MNNNKNNNKNDNLISVRTYIDLNKNKYNIYKENSNNSGIYRLINLITGKSYIGSSKS